MVRNQPLTELNALRTGSQPIMPTFQPYQGVGVGQTPIMQGAQGDAAWQQNLYNQGIGQQNAMTQGLFGLAGAGLGGFFGGPWGAAVGSQAGRAIGGGR